MAWYGPGWIHCGNMFIRAAAACRLPGDRFTGTPHFGFGFSEAGREYRMGSRLTSAVAGDPGFEVNVDANRREAGKDNDAEHGVMVSGALHW